MNKAVLKENYRMRVHQQTMELYKPTPRAVYIHIPFCTNKCHYCDFNSYVLKSQPVSDYLQAVKCELSYTVEQNPASTIDTIFVGGGTPTVLTPDQMSYFLQSVQQAFPHWNSEIEFTMEANPGTVDLQKLRAMRAGGVNRISFGVQSFDEQLLCSIGRDHTVADVYRSLDYAETAGFTNISIDLMFGLPQQTIVQVEDSIYKALQLQVPHMSIYSLKIEENTLFHMRYQRNELPLPAEEDEQNMYLLIMDRLQAAGYCQYEISNFAKPGFEGRHNIIYWRNESYYGIGAGAHGYVNGTRHMNTNGINPYLQACQAGLPRSHTLAVSKQEAMEDFMMVGLRLLAGVSREHFATQFDSASLDTVFAQPLDQLLQQKLLEVTAEGYRLTRQGLLFGNHVFGAFVGALTNGHE